MTRLPHQSTSPLLSLRTPQEGPPCEAESGNGSKGFGGRAGGARNAARSSGKARRKRRGGLSAADWGPLGKHPDLEAIVARQRLHLPERGGVHDTMQAVNGARDLLLGGVTK